MAIPLGGFDISTGNVELFNNIGGGVSSSDFASIYNNMAASEQLREQQRRAETQRNLFIVGGATWVTVIFIAVLVYLNKRRSQS